MTVTKESTHHFDCGSDQIDYTLSSRRIGKEAYVLISCDHRTFTKYFPLGVCTLDELIGLFDPQEGFARDKMFFQCLIRGFSLAGYHAPTLAA